MKNINNLTDNELKDILEPVEENNTKFINSETLPRYIANYIYNIHRSNLLSNYKLDEVIELSLEDFSNINKDNIEKNKIIEILEEDYQIKIISENPLKIEKIIK